MYAMLREGSAWHDLAEVAKAVTKHTVDSRYACLISDDTHPHTLIGEGHLVNLAAGDGHPAEIMDMSFAIQALSALYLVRNREKISRVEGEMVNDIPKEIDMEVASRKLRYWGCEIDVLTPEQRKYLYGE